MTKRLRMLVVVTVMSSMLTACSSRTFWTTLGLAGAATAGAAAVYYAKGDLETDCEKSVKDVYDAALATVRKRGYDVEEKELNASDAFIKAKIPVSGDKDKPLTIKIKSVDDGKTHFSIRAGLVGDESLSRGILEDIRKKL